MSFLERPLLAGTEEETVVLEEVGARTVEVETTVEVNVVEKDVGVGEELPRVPVDGGVVAVAAPVVEYVGGVMEELVARSQRARASCCVSSRASSAGHQR
jgi:hypothetical protein